MRRTEMSRRRFVSASAAALGVLPALDLAAPLSDVRAPRAGGGYRPWLEIDASALAHNVSTVTRLGSGRPILAVVKNNAYGLGLATAGPILERLAPVWGLAVVRAHEALALRAAGVRKPVLLMGPGSDEELNELIAHDVHLAPHSDAELERIARVARRRGRRARVHLYVDTGMHRMGMPHERVLSLVERTLPTRELRIEGAFTELTEDADFDRQQVARLREIADAARGKGVALGRLHAASSDAIMYGRGETFLDMLRPGLALYGGYVSDEAMARGELLAAYRLKARVIRVDELTPGEGVSYHRRYVAQSPTRIAVLPVGHVDGYPSGAVKGCQVLIRGQLCPVVGTVSASHTIVAVDAGAGVGPGDEATLVGPDHAALLPNEVAKRAGWSEYNMFMHLAEGLPRVPFNSRLQG